MARKKTLPVPEIQAPVPRTLDDLKREILEKTNKCYSDLKGCIEGVPVDQKVFSHVYHKLETAMLWFQHLVCSLTEKPPVKETTPQKSGDANNNEPTQ